MTKKILLYDVAEGEISGDIFQINLYGSESCREQGNVGAYRKMYIQNVPDGSLVVMNEVYGLVSLSGAKGTNTQPLKTFQQEQREDAQRFCRETLEESLEKMEKDGLRVLRSF
jgi:hypothetical protein